MDNKTKNVKGPKGACATFKRPRDGQQIWVFQKRGEAVEHAIDRVKTKNGATGVQHQTCTT